MQAGYKRKHSILGTDSDNERPDVKKLCRICRTPAKLQQSLQERIHMNVTKQYTSCCLLTKGKC